MKAFITAVIATIGIAYGANWYLQSLDYSSAARYSTESVRLSDSATARGLD